MNSEVTSIKEVYSKVEVDEQRRYVMIGKGTIVFHDVERSAFISEGTVNRTRPFRKYTYCKKSGHMVNFCWDLHPEKIIKNKDVQWGQGRIHGENKFIAVAGNTSNDMSRRKRGRRKWWSRTFKHKDEDTNDTSVVNQALAAQSDKGNNSNRK